MECTPVREHGVRSARNHTIFRAINEKALELPELFTLSNGKRQIVCECADASCLESVTIGRTAYEEVRRRGRFVVIPGHVVAEVEDVVAAADAYAVISVAPEVAASG